MKRTIVLPSLVALLAIASAFATPLSGQMAWFKAPGAPAAQGIITNPDTTIPGVSCLVTTGSVFQIGFYTAYATMLGAETQNQTGVLRYPNN